MSICCAVAWQGKVLNVLMVLPAAPASCQCPCPVLMSRNQLCPAPPASSATANGARDTNSSLQLNEAAGTTPVPRNF